MVVVNGIAVFIGQRKVDFIGVHYGGEDIILAVKFFGKIIRFFIKRFGKIVAAVFLKIFRVNIEDKLVVNFGILFQTSHRHLAFIHQLLKHFVVGEFTATSVLDIHRRSF